MTGVLRWGSAGSLEVAETFWRMSGGGARTEGPSRSVPALPRRSATGRGPAATFALTFTRPGPTCERKRRRTGYVYKVLAVCEALSGMNIGDLTSCCQRPCKVGGFILIIPLRKQTLVGKEADSTLLS